MKSLGVDILTDVTPIPPVPKYTGWARHQRVQKGLKGGTSFREALVIPDLDDVVTSSFFEILTVEDPSLFRGRAPILLKSLGKDETELTS